MSQSVLDFAIANPFLGGSEFVGHLADRLPPVGRVLLKPLHDGISDLFVQSRNEFTDRNRRFVDVLQDGIECHR